MDFLPLSNCFDFFHKVLGDMAIQEVTWGGMNLIILFDRYSLNQRMNQIINNPRYVNHHN